MIDPERFRIPLGELEELNENQTVSIDNIELWLKKYHHLHEDHKENYSCVNYRLPCYCEIRRADCKFIETYKKLNYVRNLHFYNTYFKNELEYFYSIENDVPKLKNWLLKNERYGTESFVHFDSNLKSKSIEIAVANGRSDGDISKFTISLPSRNFDSIFKFMDIFNRLFFVEKISPDRYGDWKATNNLK